MLKVIFPFAILFLFLNAVISEQGGQNPASRFATLKAMSHDFSFQIDPYKDWTADWAKTPEPNSHYFSNKPPGPMFLGFPLFFLLDHLLPSMGNGSPKGNSKLILSYVMQVLPFLFLVLFLIKRWGSTWGLGGSLFFSLAIFFGNTTSHFMNVYMGHAMSAFFLLMGVAFFWEGNRERYLSFSLGMGLLCDFGMAIVFPFVVIAFLYLQKGKIKLIQLKEIILGALIPASFWIWYHTSCFGSPFQTAAHFENPIFEQLYPTDQGANFLGLFSFSFKPQILFELILGTKRGLLFTQPWILLLIIASVFFLFSSKVLIERKLKALIIMLLGSTLILILVNSSFGGWHSGSSPGPRYFSLLFPSWAFLGAFLWASMNKLTQKILALALFIALVFKGQVLATGIMVPVENIWLWQIESIIEKSRDSGTAILRLALYWGAFILAAYFSRKKALENECCTK